MHIDLNPG